MRPSDERRNVIERSGERIRMPFVVRIINAANSRRENNADPKLQPSLAREPGDGQTLPEKFSIDLNRQPENTFVDVSAWTPKKWPVGS